ncbi:MAG: YncE family protein [Bacteroidetes bacterium]|nr:YncE family protein [Bacteroidota bacterium]
MRNFAILCTAAALCFAACRKEQQPHHPPAPAAKGLYVLNEGLFNMNNSSLTLYDLETGIAQTDFFELTNGRKLGDTGNDMGTYGSKLYIVTTGSSQLEVLDKKTGKSVAQVPLFEGSRARQPRALAFHNGYVFVACFDGKVLALDTLQFELKYLGQAGQNPDGMVLANHKLYVSNSGGLNFPAYDSTVSVFDPQTLTELRRITVGTNPGAIAADAYGDVYVVSRGNYSNIPSGITVIDSQTDLPKLRLNTEALQLYVFGDTAWITWIDYAGSMQSRIALMDVRSKHIVNPQFITDGTQPETVYGLHVDRSRGWVFVADARSFIHTGQVHVYNLSGKRQLSFTTGMNPSRMISW